MSIANKQFWDKRYVECPALGSGPGSRGYVILKKRELVRNALEALQANSIIDIGCGDLCWLDEDIVNRFPYIGLDISSVVTEKNKVTWPTLNFDVRDVVGEELPYSADLVVCFDVLIHQESHADFVNALRNTLKAARIGALISYKKSPSEAAGADDHIGLEGDGALLEQQFQLMRKQIGKIDGMAATYHGELDQEISKLFPRAIVKKIDSYRAQNVYLVTGLGVPNG